MKRTKALAVGSSLAVIGGLGIALGPSFGFTGLPDPWSFIVGFAVGVVAGIGVGLSVWGLSRKAT
jgi:hypothetical protein